MRTYLGFNGDINPYMAAIRYMDPDAPCSGSLVVYPGAMICKQNAKKVCSYIPNCDDEKMKNNRNYSNAFKEPLYTPFSVTLTNIFDLDSPVILFYCNFGD